MFMISFLKNHRLMKYVKIFIHCLYRALRININIKTQGVVYTTKISL